MPFAVHNGLRIHYEVHGEGPPMVLVHANPFDRRDRKSTRLNSSH